MDLYLEDFKEMEDLEKEYYSSEFITPYTESYMWYKKAPHSIYVEKINGEIAGFINMFPVNREVFNSIKKGEFNDAALRFSDIISIDNVKNRDNMFLSCIVVNKKYRGIGIALKMLTSSIDIYRSVNSKIENIITDNVTKDGENFSIKIGLKKEVESNHNSQIYIGNYLEFVDNVNKIR
ncbi:MAG: GNAT family N-acetyltransferase [Clostridium sp.]